MMRLYLIFNSLCLCPQLFCESLSGIRCNENRKKISLFVDHSSQTWKREGGGGGIVVSQLWNWLVIFAVKKQLGISTHYFKCLTVFSWKYFGGEMTESAFHVIHQLVVTIKCNNWIACFRDLCRKTTALSWHRCLINIGV
jgi:hypothetical protein